MSAGVRLAHVWDGELAEGRGQRGSGPGPGWRLAAGIGASRSCTPGRVAAEVACQDLASRGPGLGGPAALGVRAGAATGGGAGALADATARAARRSPRLAGRHAHGGHLAARRPSLWLAAPTAVLTKRSGWEPRAPLTFPLATGGGIRSEAAPAPRSGAPWGRPHPPAPAPIAMGEGEQLIRGRSWPSPAPPGCRGAAACRRLSPLVGLAPGARCRRTDGRALDRGSRRV